MGIGNNKKAIVISVPVPLLKTLQGIQTKLVRELEKKFNGKHVIFLAQRRILRKPVRGAQRSGKQMRPISRTLTAVHSAVLDDLVYPPKLLISASVSRWMVPNFCVFSWTTRTATTSNTSSRHFPQCIRR